MSGKIALLAGGGSLPLEFLRFAVLRVREVVTFAIKGLTEPQVEEFSSKLYWIEGINLGEFLRLLGREQPEGIAMLGRVNHRLAFTKDALDKTALSFLASLKDAKPETILRGIAVEVEKLGVKVIDPTPYLSHLLPGRGVLAGKLTENLSRDIELGMRVAREIASMDIGQTVVVKAGAVIAVEGVEGTDECIKRGAHLAGPGFTVCKSARKHQDMRFDVPTVGAETVALTAQLGGTAVAFDAQRTFFLDRESALSLAEEKGLTIVAV